MAWTLTGGDNRGSRRKHRPGIERLDARQLLSTGLGSAAAERAAHRAETVQRLRSIVDQAPAMHRPFAAAGLQNARASLAPRAALRRAALSEPVGTVAVGTPTAFDPIIGSAQARSTYGVDGSGLTVAVIDTGVNYNNPALGGGYGPGSKVIAGYDFGDGDSDPLASTSQHGTAVAGLIAGDDPGHLGVAPGADVVALKVTNGSNVADTKNIVNALQWVVDHHAEYDISVVNISLSNGGNYARNWFANDQGVGQRMTDLVKQLRGMNIPVVAATGNSFSGAQGEGFTAIIDGVISVTGTDSSDKLLSNAQRLGTAVGGPSATDIAAPASGIGALIDGSNYSNVEGTSFAAPLVSGSLVLLQSIYKQRYGTLPTVDQLQGWLKDGAAPIHDDVTGIDLGRLDVLHSAALIPGAPAVSTPPPVVVAPPSKPVVVAPPSKPVVVAPPSKPVVVAPPPAPIVTPPVAQQVLVPPPAPVAPAPDFAPSAPSVDQPTDPVEPTPTTLEVPVTLNGTAVENLSSSSVDQAASSTKLTRSDAGQLLLAMSKWASGSKSVRAWNAMTSR